MNKLLLEIIELAKKSAALFAEPKKCVKGISCGFACIEKADDCLIELSENQAALGEKLVQLIRGQKTDKDAKNLQRFDDQLGEAEALIKRGEELSEDLIDNLKSKVAEQGDFVKLVQGSAEDQNLTEDQVKTIAASVMNALPSTLQQSLGKNGSPSNWWASKDEAGADVFKDKKQMTAVDYRNRGQNVLAQYIRQGGIDAYTLGSEPMSILNMDVEHVKPLAKGGTDSPDNWVLIRGGLNKLRNNTDLVEFVKQADSWSNLTDEEKTKKIEASKQAKLGSAAIKKAEYTKDLSSDTLVQDGGKALEAQTVHQLGAKTFSRMSKSKESAGRGSSNMPANFRKALVTKAIEQRSSKYKDFKADTSGYSKDLSKEDFEAFYTKFYTGTPDKVIKTTRTEQHLSGDFDMGEILRQDKITNEINSDLLRKYSKVREARVTEFKAGTSFEDSFTNEVNKIKDLMKEDGFSEDTINDALKGWA